MVSSILKCTWLINAFKGLNEEGPGYISIPCPWASASYPTLLLWFACLCCPLAFLAYKLGLSSSGHVHHQHDQLQQPGRRAAHSAHQQPPRPHALKAKHVPSATCFCADSPMVRPTPQPEAPATTSPRPSPVLYRSSARSEVCSVKVDAHPGLDASQVRHAFSSAARDHLQEMVRASSGQNFSGWHTNVSGCVQLLVWTTGLAEGALTRFAQWREARRTQQQQQQQLMQVPEETQQAQQQQQQQGQQPPQEQPSQQQQHPLASAPQPQQQQLAQVPEEVEVVPEVLPFDKTSLDRSTAQAEKHQQQGHEISTPPSSFRFSDDSAMQERWSREHTSMGMRSSNDTAYDPFSHHVHLLLKGPTHLGPQIQEQPAGQEDSSQPTYTPPAGEVQPALPAAVLSPTSPPSTSLLPSSSTPSVAVHAPTLTSLSMLYNAMCVALPELAALPVRAQAEGQEPVVFSRHAAEGRREGGRQAEHTQLSEQPTPTTAPSTAASVQPFHLSQAAFQALSQAPAARATVPTATPTSAAATPGLGSEDGRELAISTTTSATATTTATTTTIELLSANPCVFDSRQALLASAEVQLDLSVKSSLPSIAVRVLVMTDDGAALVDEVHELLHPGSSRGARSSSSSRERGRVSTGSWFSGERGRGSSVERGRGSREGGRASNGSWGSGERGRGSSGERGRGSSVERGRGSRERGRASISSFGSGERGRGSRRGYGRSVCSEHSIRIRIPPLSMDMYDEDLGTCSLKLCVMPSQPEGRFSATVTLPSRGASALSSEGYTAEAQYFSSPDQPLLYGSCTLLALPRDVCQELQHGLLPRMCAAVEQEELDGLGHTPSEITPSPASGISLESSELAATTFLTDAAAPSSALIASMPASAARTPGSASHKAWLLHFQPLIADLELLLRAHRTFKQQQRQQQAMEPIRGQETLEQGTSMQGTSMQGTSMQDTSMQDTSMQGTSMQDTSMQGTSMQGTSMQHPATDIDGGPGAALVNANTAAWADGVPDVLQFLAAELHGFVEGAGNLGAVQQLLQRLELPS